jgi:hypothetical protein
VALQATQSDRIFVKKGDRIQPLQQQIEAWQALMEKLGGNECAIASSASQSKTAIALSP